MKKAFAQTQRPMPPSIGKVWAVCDHFGAPVTASVLKKSCEVDRQQLRKWVREGRLTEYDITTENGRRQKGYSRPGREEVNTKDAETAKGP